MGPQFKAPPGWPTPPDGWTPPAGWKPDPSWPPAPFGWAFRVTEPEPAAARYGVVGWAVRHKVLTGVGLVLVLLIVVGTVSHPKTTNASKQLTSPPAGASAAGSSSPQVLTATTRTATPAPTKVVASISAPVAVPTLSAPSTTAPPSLVAAPTAAATTAQASQAPTPAAAPQPAHTSPANKPAPTTAPAKPAPTAASKPTAAAAPAAAQLCGAPSNPYGYNFCGHGTAISTPNAGVCNYFNCIKTFWNGLGYLVECNDGTYSLSGGRSGACSSHHGEMREVFSG
jgi:hypothetical protein